MSNFATIFSKCPYRGAHDKEMNCKVTVVVFSVFQPFGATRQVAGKIADAFFCLMGCCCSHSDAARFKKQICLYKTSLTHVPA